MDQTSLSQSVIQKPHSVLWISIATAVVVVGLLVWFFGFRKTALPIPSLEPSVGSKIQNADLGSEIYEKSTNPVQGSLPETVAPIPNPLENIYKNPFQ